MLLRKLRRRFIVQEARLTEWAIYWRDRLLYRVGR